MHPLAAVNNIRIRGGIVGQQDFRPIRANEVTNLAQSMSRTFFDDPMMVYIMPNADKRMRTCSWMFAGLIQYCRRWGLVYTNENQTAASIWLKPGNTTMTPLRTIRTNLWQMPFRLGWKGAFRFGQLGSAASKVHNRVVPGDHWYLLMLGVDPESQGQGAGSAAMEIGNSQAQKEGLPVYLETMTQSNADYYLKRGFEIGEEYVVGDELRTWSMIKRPT